MTQNEVYNFLKKKRKWMSTKEIAKEMEIGSHCVGDNLNKLFKYGEVKREQIRRGNNWLYIWETKPNKQTKHL
jgi:predicted DNA-binding transcriptional regulator